MRVSDIRDPNASSAASSGTRPGAGVDSITFGDTLGYALRNIDSKTAEANTAVSKMLDGTGDVHQAMIALHEAEDALEITVAVRNKLVQAYQEIMRMPLG